MGLERFVEAQASVYEAARREISAGRKRSHWMWFVFPQLAALGRSPTAKFYGIADAAEAAAYLAHPVLGPRLVEMAGLMLRHRGQAAEAVLGAVDAMKLRSSMTLFSRVPGADPVFREVLAGFFQGEDCVLTLAALRAVFDPQDLEPVLVARQHAGDVEGMLALFEADAVVDTGEGLVRGQAAIRALFERYRVEGRRFAVGVQRTAVVNGDLAMTSTRLPDGSVTSEVARRQSDGSWRWVIDRYSVG
jgi:uncharacterized protein (DUF1810 family)